MPGILANSADHTMVSGDEAEDRVVSGYVSRSRVHLTVLPEPSRVTWQLGAPGDSSGASISDRDSNAPSFMPDVAGTWVVVATVNGATTYVLRIVVLDRVGTLASGSFRLMPVRPEQVLAPSGGKEVFLDSTDGSKLKAKDSDENVEDFQGEQGEAGEQGEPGPQGLQGPPGPPGEGAGEGHEFLDEANALVPHEPFSQILGAYPIDDSGNTRTIHDFGQFDARNYASLSAAAAQRPGETIVAPGTFEVDDDLPDTVTLKLKRNSDLSVVESRVIAASLEASEGGIIRVGDGATLTVSRYVAEDYQQLFELASSAVIRFAKKGRGYLTPYHLGAAGDDEQDDTRFVQLVATASRIDGIRAHFPEGRHALTGTIELGNTGGAYWLFESGSSERRNDYPHSNTKPDYSTKFIWRGADGGTVISTRGTECQFYGGFNIHGGDVNNPVSSRPGIGLLLTKEPGIDSGRSKFDAIAFSNCDVGFQCGLSAAESNCDNLFFGSFYANTCDSAFKVLNDQGQVHKFSFVHCNLVGTILDYVRGGPCAVDFLYAAGISTILKVTSGGSAVSDYMIGFVKLDAQMTARVVWLLDLGGNCNVHFRGGIANSLRNQLNSGVAAFQITNNTDLLVENVAGGMCGPGSPLAKLTTTDVGSQNQNPKAVFRNCHLGGIEAGVAYFLDPDVEPVVQFSGDNAHRYWELDHCYLNNTQRFPTAHIGNWSAKRHGSGTVLDGQSSVTVEHGIFGLGGTSGDLIVPDIRPVLTQAYSGGWHVTNVNGTTFDFVREGSTSGALNFDFTAEIEPGRVGTSYNPNLFADPGDFGSASWAKSAGLDVTYEVDPTTITEEDPVGLSGWHVTDSVDASAISHTISQTPAAAQLNVQTTLRWRFRPQALVDGGIEKIVSVGQAASSRVSFDVATLAVDSQVSATGLVEGPDNEGIWTLIHVFTPTSTKLVQIRMQKTSAGTYQGNGDRQYWLYSASCTQPP